jgi:hypothetical protein
MIMDPPVALVQAYLQINGYFTITEYAVVEAVGRAGNYRTSTDLDVLAVRFPGAGHTVIRRRRRAGEAAELAPDPALDVPDDRIDMIVGEVKEGRAELNRGARDPHVLQAVLTRFGCCPPAAAPNVVADLLQHGVSNLSPPHGHRTRLVAFGTRTGEPLGYPCLVISLARVVEFLQGFLREHWDILRHAPSKDATMGLLMTLEKTRLQPDQGREPHASANGT